MARTRTLIAIGPAALVATTIASGAMAAGDTICQKTVKGIGRPHDIKTVAQLNAVGAWAQAARQYGEGYAVWHNADRATIACETFDRGDFRCVARAKPCLPHDDQASR